LDRAFARVTVVFEMVNRVFSSEGWSLAERSMDFPSTPGIGGAGMVLIASKSLSALPSGMGKAIMFVDVTIMICFEEKIPS